MAYRDRLAAIRTQQGGGDSYGSVPQNPYDRRDLEYGQPTQYGNQQSQNNRGDNYELQQVTNGGGYGNQYGGAPADDMNTFYNEIEAIQDDVRNFNANIDQISRLHSSLLANVEPGNSRSNQQLENMIEETRGMMGNIKNRIKSLQMQPVDEKAANMRKPHIDRVRENFMQSINKYQSVEKEYRDKYKERMARQFRIVNPNATDAEVAEVVNGDQSVQIFAQAAMGNRYADSQRAYREVQQRHEEIKRIERNMEQLAQLFNDMSLLVEQQDDQINVIHSNAQNVTEDMGQAKKQLDSAVVSAKRYRKGRWICLALTLVILAVVGIAVGIQVSKNVNNGSSNNNNSNSNSNNNSTS